MRLAFLLLLASTLLLQQASLARADDVRSREAYIVNGEPAGQADIRGTVAVASLSEEQAQDEFAPESLFWGRWCSGVLIAPTVVLTAAHCTEQCFWYTCEDSNGEPRDCYDCVQEPIPADRVYVAAGSRTLDDLRNAEVVPVRDLFVPEQYVTSAYWSLDVGECEQLGADGPSCERPGFSPDAHDIAILVLDAPVTTLNPMRLLASVDDLAGAVGVAIGYGDRTQPGSDELLNQDRYLSILHQTTTPVEQVTDQEILTAAGENHSGVCFGDSGSPLYVQKGSDLFVAGLASRFRFDADGPICGVGAIYTSAPAYADWIFEKAPEANPLTLSGGGGCSAAPGKMTRSGPLLIGMLLLLVLCVRVRPTALTAAPFVLVTATLIGCGSGTPSDVSLCTETHDPYRIFCNPDAEMIELRAAEALARSEVPEDALLWMVHSSPTGLLDPDGRADAWRFAYYLPGRRELPEAEFREITVYPEMTFVVEYTGSELACIPTEPIPVLDSRQLMHDAIRFMDSQGTTVRLGDGRNLFLIQQHLCDEGDASRNRITYDRMTAYFDDSGTFFKLEDPPKKANPPADAGT